mgnify:CR=1 FL=1
MKIASSFFPDKKRISETIIIEMTTKSIITFIMPMRLIKFLIIATIQNPLNISIKLIPNY